MSKYDDCRRVDNRYTTAEKGLLWIGMAIHDYNVTFE